MPSKPTALCNLIRRSDSGNSTMGIGVSTTYTVETFGTFSKDSPTPQGFRAFIAGLKVQIGQVLGDMLFLHSILPTHRPPYSCTLPPTQTDPFHTGKEAAIHYPVSPVIVDCIRNGLWT